MVNSTTEAVPEQAMRLSSCKPMSDEIRRIVAETVQKLREPMSARSVLEDKFRRSENIMDWLLYAFLAVEVAAIFWFAILRNYLV